MRLPRLICLSLGLALAASPGHATKLEKPICDDLKVEQGLLQQKGIPADMAKGPDWAKTNLSRDRLREIERLIHVEEQLAFRCPQPKKPPSPAEDEDGNIVAAPAKGGAKAGAKAAMAKVKAQKAQIKAAADDAAEAPTPAKKAAKAAPAAPAAKGTAAATTNAKAVVKPSVAAEAASTSAQEGGTAAPPKKTTPKPKPKVNDAYSPPPEAAAKSVFKN